MSLRHLSAPRLRRSLLLTSLLLAGSFSAHAAEEMLRKAVRWIKAVSFTVSIRRLSKSRRLFITI